MSLEHESEGTRRRGARLAAAVLAAPLAAAVLAGAVSALALLPARASAQDPGRLRWSDDWARVHPAAYVAEGVAIAGSLTLDQLYVPPEEANARGASPFDAAAREALAASTDDGREAAATLSDVLLGALIAWPVVIDAYLVAGLIDQSSDVAWQLSMVAAETIAADFVLSTLLKLLVDRERPHADRCSVAERVSDPRRCGRRGRTRSFYSGHASGAFNAAGLMCITHAHLPLYEEPAADAFACGAALLTASVVSTLRLIADRHHLSDVLVGAAVGLLTGALLPYALHFGWDPTGDPSGGMAEPLRAAGRREVHVPLLAGAF